MARLTKARKQAWETRRKRYGKKGHNSAYTRPPLCCAPANPYARKLIVKLHLEEILSEGQASKALGMHRIEFRKLCDASQPQREER